MWSTDGTGILSSRTPAATAAATHDAYIAMAVIAVFATWVAWRQRGVARPAPPTA